MSPLVFAAGLAAGIVIAWAVLRLVARRWMRDLEGDIERMHAAADEFERRSGDRVSLRVVRSRQGGTPWRSRA